MSPNSRPDRQAFEAFLANAFAVQKSGLDAQSLSALAEVQRFISMAELNVDRALNLIASCSLKIANASGVAIARLESNQLTYCAATGSAAKETGRRLPAVFSLCAQSEGKTEILRVENAQTDPRIQAEICRQFDAASLLILPICDQQVIAGIFQVHFGEPHSFLDPEVRAYRLMAGLAADVISGTFEPTQAEAPIALTGTADVIQCYLSHGNALSANGGLSSQDMQASTGPDRIPAVQELAGVAPAAAQQWVQRARRIFANHVWEWQTMSAAIVLTIILGIAHFHHPAPTALGLTISAPSTREKLPDPPASVNERKRFDHAAKDGMAPNLRFRRVRIGPNEVDYIAQDVTVRHFTNSQPRPQRNVRLVNIGDDVTVRYFSSDSTAASQAIPLSTMPTTK